MLHYRLPPKPIESVYDLPFKPSSKACVQWLNELSLGPKNQSRQRLLQALWAIESADLTPENKLQLALTIVDHEVTNVGDIYYQAFDAGLPLTEREGAEVEVENWIYQQLISLLTPFLTAPVHEYISKSEKNKLVLLNSYLACTRFLLLVASQLYSEMPKGFWQQFYDLWLRYGNIARPQFEFVILFASLPANQFRPQDLRWIFKRLESVAKHMKIVSTPPDKAVNIIYFDYKSDKKPVKWRPKSDGFTTSSVFFDQATLCPFIYEKFTLGKVPKSWHQISGSILNLQVARQFSGQIQRQHTRFPSKEARNGWVGFSIIKQKLAQTKGLEKHVLFPKLRHEKKLAGLWTVPDYDLMPEGEEVLQFKSSNVQQKKFSTVSVFEPTTDQQQHLFVFQILNSSIKGYGLSSSSISVKMKIGEVLVTKPENNSAFEVGVITRLEYLKSGEWFVAVRLLALECEAVWLEHIGNDTQCSGVALLLPETKNSNRGESLLISSGYYPAGMTVVLVREINAEPEMFRLGRVMLMTATVSQYELVSP